MGFGKGGVNMCDLAFFRALATAVHKLRRGRRTFDIEQLVADVEQAFKEYPSEKLDKMWSTLESNCLKIIKAKGGNDYDQPAPHHGSTAEKQAQERRAAKRQKK